MKSGSNRALNPEAKCDAPFASITLDRIECSRRVTL